MSAKQQQRGLDRERFMLEVRRARRPFAVCVAFVAFCGVMGLVILANTGTTRPGADRYETRIEVDNASGISPGNNDVRLRGVTIGKITKLELEGGRAVATISVDPEHGPLYRDTRLRLRPRTPLNDLFLDIEDRGSSGPGALGENDILPIERTHRFVDVGRLLNVFDPSKRSRVKEAVDELGRGLPDHGDDLRATLVELAPFFAAAKRLTQVTADRQTQTQRLMHNLRLITEELARRQGQVRQLVRAGAPALTAIGQREVALQRVLAELPPTMTRLQSSFGVLRAAADELDPAFDALQPTASAMPAGLKALGRFGTTAEPALRALRKPLPSLRRLVRNARPVASTLARAFSGLRPIAPRLDRITGLIGPCERPLQKFFTNTLSLTKFYDRRAPILRGIVVLAGGGAPQPNQSVSKSCAPGGPTK